LLIIALICVEFGNFIYTLISIPFGAPGNSCLAFQRLSLTLVLFYSATTLVYFVEFASGC
jgi:hypothetical protein